VLCAEPVVGRQPFAVLLPDDLIWNRGPGALAQMTGWVAEHGGSVLAVQDVPLEQTRSYGIVATDPFLGRAGRIRAMVEKPRPEEAPSTLAVVGRYVLQPEVFDRLRAQAPGQGGEIQLTDAIAAMLAESAVHAFRFQGTRFDCGTHLGLVEATIRYALDHEQLSEAARRLMQNALDELGVADLD
jgi:UTP--glucose-1-phosphate uridylyltransferase